MTPLPETCTYPACVKERVALFDTCEDHTLTCGHEECDRYAVIMPGRIMRREGKRMLRVACHDGHESWVEAPEWWYRTQKRRRSVRGFYYR